VKVDDDCVSPLSTEEKRASSSWKLWSNYVL